MRSYQEDSSPGRVSGPAKGIGGSVSADFVNTLDWRLRPVPAELLGSVESLLRWGRSAGILALEEARTLRDRGKAHPAAAGKALARLVGVREAIAETFAAVVREAPIPPGPLARLDTACREAGSARALRPDDAGAAWAWRGERPGSDQVAWAVALDAARILTSSDRRRLRQCGDRECGWFFLDTSRNRRRRCCSMKSCGNRNKARAFYRRSLHAAGEREG